MSIKNKTKFFEQVLAQLPGEIVVFDIDHRYVYANAIAFSDPVMRKKIIGMNDFEYCEFRGKDLAIAQKRKEIFDKVISSKKEIEWEEKFTDKEGNDKYFVRRCSPIIEDDEEISGFIGYGIDITERKMLEQEKSRQQIFLQQILDASPHLIFVKDAAGKFLMVNNAMTVSLGVPKENIINKYNDAINVNEEELKQYATNDSVVINTLRTIRLEEKFTKKDGTVIIYDTVKSPIIESDGKVNVLGISTDITELKLAEEKARLSEQHLADAQQMALSGSWEYNVEDKKITWSRGMFDLFERDPASGPASEEEYKTLIDATSLAKIEKRFNDLYNGIPIQELEYAIHLKSGIKIVRTVAKLEHNSAGKIIRILGTVIDVTQQKEIENLLRDKEQRLVEAQHLAKIGNFEFDLITFDIYWSTGCYEIFKRDPERGVPGFEEYRSMIYPDDRKYFEGLMEILFERKEPFETDYRIVCEDGEVRHLHVNNKILLDENKKPIKIFGTLSNVTQQKVAEQILRLNEQRLLEVQELTRVGAWQYDVLTKEMEWSDGAFKIWGMDQLGEKPTYEIFEQTIHLEDRQLVSEVIQETISTGEPFIIEYRIHLSDQSEKIIQARGKALKNVEEKVIRLYGSVLDITERKQTENILRLNEQRLNEAQRMAKTGSFEFDASEKIIYWSRGCFDIWERNLESGHPTFDEFAATVHPDDYEKIVGNTMNYMEAGVPFDSEYRIFTSSGNIKHIHGKTIVVKNELGVARKFFGTVADITQQKFTEDELINAKALAEESIRAKEYFLANVSHELRTPLNGILGMARLLNKTELSATQRNYIEILNRTAGNLLIIINDILDIAKIESGTLTLDKVDFDISRVSDTAVQTQLYKAEEKDVVIRHMLDKIELPNVVGDPFRLNQILLNLLSNAIKFTEQGEVVLRHQVIEETDDVVVIEFTVADTGIGIPEEMQQYIFNSFMQVHGNSPNRYGGTGLGLAISKNLVECQGGKIWVKSIEGKGSTFGFSIPYAKAVHTTELKPTSNRINTDNIGVLNILLAEDNQVNQFITEAMLQDWGFKVDIANNGREAVEMMKSSNYDLILMDIQMPELNGVEATKLIRALADTKKAEVPIIALTANTTRQAQKKFLADGMDDYLVKPFKEETLFRKIITHVHSNEHLPNSIPPSRFPVRKRPVLSGNQLYDLNLLKRDARNNTAFVRRMLSLFIDTIPPIIEKMDDHFSKGEMDAVCTMAHKIKPTLDGAGIFTLRDVIRNIENYREKKRTRDQLQKDLLQLRKVIAMVTLAFHSEIEQLDKEEKERNIFSKE